MNVTPTFLVSLMVVTLLGLGISGLLGALSELTTQGRAGAGRDAVRIAWLLLLLGVYLNFFWQITLIWNVDDWSFGGFVFMLSGPVVLYLSSNVLIDDRVAAGAEAERPVTSRFFLIFAYVPCWALGAEQAVGLGFTGSSPFQIANAVLLAVLALRREPAFHRLGVVVAWVLYATALGLRSFGLTT